jgi:tetratricopeptide (TPR) repeat protein
MKKKKAKQPVKARENTGGDISKTGALHLLSFALLVLACLIVYNNSLSNEFVYDDFATIVENKHLEHPGTFIPALFNRSYFKVASLEASYRPVATLSYFLIYSVAELDSFYFHLASLLLHMFNAMLVYWMANLVLQNRLQALIAGLLFACHPALSEAVNCISYNEDLLAGFFFLLAFIFYIRMEADSITSNIRYYALALLFYFLGLLSKEMAITLPAIILLYDLTLRNADGHSLSLKHLSSILKKRKYFYSGYIAVSLFYLLIRFILLTSPREFMKPASTGLFERVMFLPGHIFSFIRMALYPNNLTADYVFSYPDSFFDSMNLAGFVVVIGLAGASFVIYRHCKEIFFGIWWFLITLFPVSNLITIYHPFAERYLYLPLIGLCLVVSILVSALARKIVNHPTAATLATLLPVIVVVSLYAKATMARNRVWQNNFVLWTTTVQTSPDSPIARGGLGMAYLDQGRLDEAREQFEMAIRLLPNDYQSYYNLGLVYHRKGNWQTAVDNFKRSVAIHPGATRAHYNLATLYAMRGLIDPAIQHYSSVIELDPEAIEAHYNLGLAYATQGNLIRAISEWESVLELDPYHRSAKNNLKTAKMMMKNPGRQN